MSNVGPDDGERAPVFEMGALQTLIQKNWVAAFQDAVSELDVLDGAHRTKFFVEPADSIEDRTAHGPQSGPEGRRI